MTPTSKIAAGCHGRAGNAAVATLPSLVGVQAAADNATLRAPAPEVASVLWSGDHAVRIEGYGSLVECDPTSVPLRGHAVLASDAVGNAVVT